MACFRDKKFYYSRDIVTKNDDLSCSTYWGWRAPQIEPPDTYINCKVIAVDFSNIRLRHRFPAPIIFRECTFYYCTFDDVDYCTFDHCTFKDCKFSGTFKASLFGCNFDTHVPYVPMTCPAEGDIIGWKVCRGQNNRTPYLVELHIPDRVKRTSGFGSRKCRCERALVLDILHIDGTPAKETTVVSHYDKTFMYTKGDWVYPYLYDNDRRFICSGGIHFFMERQEAINYYESELV